MFGSEWAHARRWRGAREADVEEALASHPNGLTGRAHLGRERFLSICARRVFVPKMAMVARVVQRNG